MCVYNMMLKLVLAFALICCCRGSPRCVSRDYGHGSVVCVCNSTYCDTFEPSHTKLQVGEALQFVSSKAGLRLQQYNLNFSSASELTGAAANVTTLTVNKTQIYQRVRGFGASVLGVSPINTYSLSTAAADKLIRAYFSEEGIRYSFLRVPIGPTDFSARYYELTGSHQNNATLENFNLTEEDTSYKIPFLKQALAATTRRVKLFATPWTAPQWMKEADNATGKTSLRPEYYETYAKYYVKFLDAYKKEGVRFWGLTPQNEPAAPEILGNIVSMSWTPQHMQHFLINHLGPALNESGYDKLHTMLIDDNRNNIPEWLEILKNDTLRGHISGLAVHWFSDKFTPASVLDDAHTQHPDKFILYTEACPQRLYGEQRVILGNWTDGANYISSIIEVMNHWVTGWLDLNLAVNLDGGPNWLNRTLDDAPVVVNATADEFYKQPSFYSIAHVSRFVLPDFVRVGLKSSGGDLESVAFHGQNGTTIVILHNKDDVEVKAVINDPDRGSLSLDIPANSIHTVLYK